MTDNRTRYFLFVVFAVSGFSGLIYESIWSHYLKLFLGHAAYAQALVLAIFMGGMALGAWLASRYSAKWPNLLLAYAIVEAIIGVCGIVFHPLFKFILDLSFDTIIPQIDSIAIVQIYKWSLCTTLILPQSILLGMTFPLMSNGLIRLFPNTEGDSLAMLYFTNTLGATFGVLVAGFVLIATVGLPGTILCAGLINVGLAIVSWQLAKGKSAPPLFESVLEQASGLSRLMISAAFLTGLSSFIYEIAWIRMLSMVLGASTHSFELMLSAFLLGLALGGLLIRLRIDQLIDPIRSAGHIQIVMGLCAIATVVLYNHSFDWMAYLMSGLSHTDAGFNLFAFAGQMIAMLIMLPTTVCAGMTLPLFTKILLRKGFGERSIGRIYASNTLGAILGVIFAMFIAMPILGLKNAIIIGAAIDVIIGLVFLTRCVSTIRKPRLIYFTTLILCVFAIVSRVEFDFKKMASTVFRTGTATLDSNYKLLFHEDGKTATVHVVSTNQEFVTISTNGKPDARVRVRGNETIGGDEPTTILLASIPLSINPNIRTAANIGMGSGMTTHVLLSWSGIESVDTIEIESAMVEGAKHFRPRAERTFSDPRSHIRLEDAKTYFANQRKKYDLITSEPSNPWVSGVASLFTDEFYGRVKNYLNPDGIFIQWLQPYEINIPLIKSVLKALDNNFSYYNLYSASNVDFFIVASRNAPLGMPKPNIFEDSDLRRELATIDVQNVEDLKSHFLANEKQIRPWLRLTNPAPNSDFFPILDLNAARSRFKQERAGNMTNLRINPVPVINMLVPEYENREGVHISRGFYYDTSRLMFNSKNIYDYLILRKKNDELVHASEIDLLRRLTLDCSDEADFNLWLTNILSFYRAVGSTLNPNELNTVWEYLTPACPHKLTELQGQWLKLMKAIARRDAEAIVDSATALWANEPQIEAQDKKVIFDALMLALVKTGEFAPAVALWTEYSEKIHGTDIPVEIQFLYGIAMQSQ